MDTNRITTSTDQDVGGLIKGAFQDLEKLATQHIKLFKKELRDETTRAAEGLVALLIGLNVLCIGGVLLGIAASYGLIAAGLPYWASFLIIGAVVCLGGGVALLIAQDRIKSATPLAERTLTEVEEDAKWLTNPK